jgi:hypothetical protein
MLVSRRSGPAYEVITFVSGFVQRKELLAQGRSHLNSHVIKDDIDTLINC